MTAKAEAFARLIADAAINIYPDLEAKRDIVQNAIDLAQIVTARFPCIPVSFNIT